MTSYFNVVTTIDGITRVNEDLVFGYESIMYGRLLVMFWYLQKLWYTVTLLKHKDFITFRILDRYIFFTLYIGSLKRYSIFSIGSINCKTEPHCPLEGFDTLGYNDLCRSRRFSEAVEPGHISARSIHPRATSELIIQAGVLFNRKMTITLNFPNFEMGTSISNWLMNTDLVKFSVPIQKKYH